MAEVVVTVSGPTGSGKSRIMHEIGIALKAVGVTVRWTDHNDERDAMAKAHSEQSGGWQPELPDVWLQEINTPTSIAAGMQALAVPEIWSEVERDGMALAYGEAHKRHGHFESLFAAAAWLLRHRASQVS